MKLTTPLDLLAGQRRPVRAEIVDAQRNDLLAVDADADFQYADDLKNWQRSLRGLEGPRQVAKRAIEFVAGQPLPSQPEFDANSGIDYRAGTELAISKVEWVYGVLSLRGIRHAIAGSEIIEYGRDLLQELYEPDESDPNYEGEEIT